MVERKPGEPLANVAGNHDEHRVQAYADMSFSDTDATGFGVMEHLGIATAFSFDRHSEELGGDDARSCCLFGRIRTPLARYRP